ncbi:MAG: transglutaminase domain-containing protein [Hominimerdicola sp.]
MMKKNLNLKGIAILIAALCLVFSDCSMDVSFDLSGNCDYSDYNDNCGESGVVTDYEETHTKINYQVGEKDISSSEISEEKREELEKTEVTTAAEYFLDYLTESEQTVFKQIYTGLSNFETNISIENGVIKRDEICDFLSFCIVVSPELNYISSEYLITLDENDYVMGLEVSYDKDKAQVESEYEELEKAVDEILQGLENSWSDYEKVMYLHDQIILGCVYNEESEQPYSAYGCLVLGEAVCEGYTKAMMMLCESAGIQCIPVLGKGFENGDGQPHGWNKIMLDGEWYNFDLTWDDPISDMGEDYIRYDYFALTDEEISADHMVDENRFMNYPVANDDENNYYERNGLLVGKYDDPLEIVAYAVESAMASNQNYARIKCSSQEVYERASEVIISESKSGSDEIFEILQNAAENSEYSYDSTRYSVITNESKCMFTIKLSRE